MAIRDTQTDAGTNEQSDTAADNAISVEAADQILAEIEKTLHEMRALAKMAADNPLSAAQRKRIQARINYLKKEIDGIAAMLY